MPVSLRQGSSTFYIRKALRQLMPITLWRRSDLWRPDAAQPCPACPICCSEDTELPTRGSAGPGWFSHPAMRRAAHPCPLYCQMFVSESPADMTDSISQRLTFPAEFCHRRRVVCVPGGGRLSSTVATRKMSGMVAPSFSKSGPLCHSFSSCVTSTTACSAGSHNEDVQRSVSVCSSSLSPAPCATASPAASCTPPLALQEIRARDIAEDPGVSNEGGATVSHLFSCTYQLRLG